MSTPEQEATRAKWGRMAANWERMRPRLVDVFEPCVDWLVEHLDATPGETILELACGTGDIGFRVAPRVQPGGRVISSDFAPEMVEAARRFAADLSLDNVEPRVLDAMAIDLPDDSVDGVLCRWGYMLLPDPAAGFAETRRVLRPGGRVALATWAPLEKNRIVVMGASVAGRLGLTERIDPHVPGGMFSIPTGEAMISSLRAAGFTSWEIEEVECPWPLASFEDAWDWYTTMNSAVAEGIPDWSDDQVAAFDRALREALEPYRSGDGYDGSAVTLNAVAS